MPERDTNEVAELVARLKFQLSALIVGHNVFWHQTLVHVLHVALLDEALLDVDVIHCIVEGAVVVPEDKVFHPGPFLPILGLHALALRL